MKETQSRFEQFVIYILIIANKKSDVMISYNVTQKTPSERN